MPSTANGPSHSTSKANGNGTSTSLEMIDNLQTRNNTADTHSAIEEIDGRSGSALGGIIKPQWFASHKFQVV